MNDDQTTQLQGWIDRMRSGDASARNELIGHAYERLRRLAKKILHEDFPRLENVHSPDTVLHEAIQRLLNDLNKVQVTSVRDFFRFSALLMRRTLLNLAEKYDRRRQHVLEGNVMQQDASEEAPGREPSSTTDDPRKLAMWTEFHEKVEELPEELREVVDLYLYQELTQAEIADLLGTYQREIGRRWMKAIGMLPPLPE